MKYFKDSKNKIFAYEDEDIAKVDEYNQTDEKENFSDFISDLAKKLKDLTEATEQEALTIANPPPTDEEVKRMRIAEVDAELARLDAEAIRPLRAINAGTDMQYDRDKLADLDLQASTLRTEREGLV